MITADEFIEPFKFEFKPCWIVKVMNGNIVVCSQKPNLITTDKEPGLAWDFSDGQICTLPPVDIAEFKGKGWSDCILELGSYGIPEDWEDCLVWCSNYSPCPAGAGVGFIDIFIAYDPDDEYPFSTIGGRYKYCVPVKPNEVEFYNPKVA